MEDRFRPVAQVHFYPEDEPFNLLVQSMRNTLRAYELFDLARIVLDKPDRFVVVVYPPEEPKRPAEEQVVFQSAPDGLPFLDRQEAVDHVMANFMEQFAEVLEETVEPPKGTFPVIHRCGYTRKIIGPPNHHLYQRLLREHHARELPHLPFDKVRGRMESCKDEEAREEWLRTMTTVRRYRLRSKSPSVTENTPVAEDIPLPETAPVAEDGPVGVAGEQLDPGEVADEPSAEVAGEASTDSDPPSVPTPASSELVFDSVEELKRHLLEHRADDLVKGLPFVRFSGKSIDVLPQGSLRETIVRLWQDQQKFPLDTANHLRGKLRKAQFSIFKRGGGINFVCAVRRRRRPAGGTFSPTSAKILAYLDEHRDVKAPQVMRDLFGLGSLDIPESVRKSFAQDLRWLKSEGYVIEYADGRLEAQAVEEKMVDSKQKAKASPSSQAETKTAALESPEPVTESAPAAAEEPSTNSAPLEGDDEDPEASA